MKTVEAKKSDGKRLGLGLTPAETRELQDSMQGYGKYLAWGGPIIILVILLSVVYGALTGN